MCWKRGERGVQGVQGEEPGARIQESGGAASDAALGMQWFLLISVQKKPVLEDRRLLITDLLTTYY